MNQSCVLIYHYLSWFGPDCDMGLMLGEYRPLCSHSVNCRLRTNLFALLSDMGRPVIEPGPSPLPNACVRP